jgi:hypothetical protein
MRDEFHHMGDPEQAKALFERLASGTISPTEAISIISELMVPGNHTRDCTLEYRCVLYALGFGELADQVDDIRIRLGDGVISVGVSMNTPNVDLSSANDAVHTAMGDALMAVLRGHGLKAGRDEDGHIVLDSNDNSDDVVASFVTDMDATLGPSIPEPGASRWDRWM